jgi:pimeloyl-ACP methyl ester carboxylesterase
MLLLITGCGTTQKPTANPSSIANGKSHFARFGTNKVHYVTVGKGKKVVVFVHGWACNAAFWREQTPAIKDKAKLILIDLPGHGESDKPQTDYSMDFFADAVIAVLKDAKVEKAVLVGHSMGTPVICRVYAHAPEAVSAQVSVDGTLRRPKMQPDQAEKFVARYRGADYRDNVTRFVTSMFPDPGTEPLRDWALAEMLKTPQHVMSSAMEAMFSSTHPDWNPGKVHVPVLVINTKNPMWTKDYENYVRTLSRKTDYRTIEGAGHFVMLEKPAEFNAALIEMLGKCDLIN